MSRWDKARCWLWHELGHWISKPMEWFDWGWLYPAYDWCMLRSAELDTEDWMWASK